MTKLGKYELLELIGRGGVSDVYKAWNPEYVTYLAIDRVCRVWFKREVQSGGIDSEVINEPLTQSSVIPSPLVLLY